MVSMTTEYSKYQVIGLAVSFMILPVVFYSLRLWARLLIGRFTLDDYLAGAGLVFSTICCSLQLAAAIEGRLGTHQALLPDGTPDMNDPGLAFFENSKFAMNMLSILGLGLIKCSILVLYLNLFPSKTFRWFLWAALTYVVAWTVSFFVSHLFTCFPITTFIDFFEDKTCVDQSAMFLSVLYTGVAADFFILLLPMPMIWSLQMRLKMKLAVIGMLSLGAATCGIGVARVMAITSVAAEYVKHPNDIIYYTAPVFYWTNIELSMAVVCACLPTLRPIWFHFYPKTEISGNMSYEYGHGAKASRSSRKHKAGSSSDGVCMGRNNHSTSYLEIDDDVELADRYHVGRGGGEAVGTSSRSQMPGNGDIVKQIVIAQTVDSSSTTDLRPIGGLRYHGGMWTPVRPSRQES